MESFAEFFRQVWLSPLPRRLAYAICVAAVFEALVWAINGRIRVALRPALARDKRGDPVARARRMRLLLRPPMAANRAVMYTAAIAMILRIFGLPLRMELLPIAGGALAAALVASWPVLQDAVRGWLLVYQFAYAEGDEVTIADLRGRVAAIGLTATVLRLEDGSEARVASGEIRRVVNHSRREAAKEGEQPAG